MPMRTRSLVQSPTESWCGRLKVGRLNGRFLATRRVAMVQVIDLPEILQPGEIALDAGLR